MKIAYIDMPSGISGDMLLGALVGAGVPVGALRDGLSGIKVEPFEISAENVERKGFGATCVRVELSPDAKSSERNLGDVTKIISAAGLSPIVTDRALAVFRNLAEAEAEVHGKDVEEIHFHEVGAVDAIADIVGSCIGLEYLGIEKLYASPFSLGTGTVKCAHGELPVPAPATMKLVSGFPVRMTGISFELTTPTGAALVTTLASGFGDVPVFKPLVTGIGAGGDRDQPIPNICRLIVGESAEARAPMFEIQVNIDDMSPEMMELAFEKCFEAGALDVWVAPITMKKSRPGHIFGLIVPEPVLGEVEKAIFETTTTFGLRRTPISRSELDRKIVSVETSAGAVDVKIGSRDGVPVIASPEYESVKRLCAGKGVSFKRIYAEAQAAAWKQIRN
ncbi:MAG: nickel pincer cofactor biosynthesis protein LarC [Planctomycetota bacterium]